MKKQRTLLGLFVGIFVAMAACSILGDQSVASAQPAFTNFESKTESSCSFCIKTHIVRPTAQVSVAGNQKVGSAPFAGVSPVTL